MNELIELETDRFFERKLDLDDGLVLKVYQETVSDVGGVVWDSAIVVSHYIARNAGFWKGKKVLEVGAGTGVCSIALAAFGATVFATDLEARLPLIRKNILANAQFIGRCGGQVFVKEFDWDKPLSSVKEFDEIFVVDAFYYTKGVHSLMNKLRQIKSSRILCAYEKRDIGEPKIAQAEFLKLASNYFLIEEIPECMLDPVYSHEDIKIFYMISKA